VLKVQVWSNVTFSDGLIGEGFTNLSHCYKNPYISDNKYFDLINKGENVGRILISL
jgi:hypothetical protein